MNAAEVRRRCDERLAELQRAGLHVPDPFDATELAASTSRCLSAAVELVAIDMPAGAPYGLTLFTDDGGHIIAYEQSTTRLHRDHIIGHELAHIMLRHEPMTVEEPTVTQLIFPTLPPSLVHRVLNRTGAYTRAEEQEAETLATMLMEYGSQATTEPGFSHLTPDDAAIAARFSQLFERPR